MFSCGFESSGKNIKIATFEFMVPALLFVDKNVWFWLEGGGMGSYCNIPESQVLELWGWFHFCYLSRLYRHLMVHLLETKTKILCKFSTTNVYCMYMP